MLRRTRQRSSRPLSTIVDGRLGSSGVTSACEMSGCFPGRVDKSFGIEVTFYEEITDYRGDVRQTTTSPWEPAVSARMSRRRE
jgi:hypothetical protein